MTRERNFTAKEKKLEKAVIHRRTASGVMKRVSNT